MTDQQHADDVSALYVWEAVEFILKNLPGKSRREVIQQAIEDADFKMARDTNRSVLIKEADKAYDFYYGK